MNNLDFFEYHKNHECKQCLEKEQVYDSAQEFLQEIVKQLYTNDPLDKNSLEHSLDELCFLLNVKMRTSDLNIQRHIQPKESLNTWIKFNNSYLKQLVH